MRIDKLELTNFRCFEHTIINLAPRFTLLIGENGSGKTAALDALAVAAGAFLLGLPRAPSRPIRAEEFRRADFEIGRPATTEPAGGVVVAAAGVVPSPGDAPDVRISWSRSLTAPHRLTTRGDAQGIVEPAAKLGARLHSKWSTLIPVLAYYGKGRRWECSERIQMKGADSRVFGYRKCLNPAPDVPALFRWFKKNELAASRKREPHPLLEAVKRAVVSMIPGAISCCWDLELDQIVLELELRNQRLRVPFRQLSDGHQNIVGLAADTARRMAMLNPHLLDEVTAKTPGIVLIDEIDLHLHSAWQQQVVDSLMRVFPRVQFVATSHSPFILESLVGVQDTTAWDLSKSEAAVSNPYSIEYTVENDEGVAIPPQSANLLEMEAAAEEYNQLLGEEEGSDEERKYEVKTRLDAIWTRFGEEPEFRAFLKTEQPSAEPDEGDQ